MMANLFKTSYRYAGLWIVLGLFLLTACSTMPAKDSASAAKISVTGNGLPKADLIIEGAGFKAGEAVELEIDMDGLPILIGEQENKPVVASDKGILKVKSSYPDNKILVPGTWDLRATGNKGSKAACKVVMKLK